MREGFPSRLRQNVCVTSYALYPSAACATKLHAHPRRTWRLAAGTLWRIIRGMATGTSSYRVLGIDPGLHITGYGCVEFGPGEPRIVEAGTLRTSPKADMSERLHQIHRDLTELLGELRPDVVAIEQLYSHYAHPRTSILMGHGRGVILLACKQAAIPVRNMPATKVKKSLCGNGHASKLQMQRSIQAVCKLPELPNPPDVADALAIALCAGRGI